MTTLAPFAIHSARSVTEATRFLEDLGDEAVVYSGGTELLLLMKLGFAAYRHLIDVKSIAELGRLEVVDGTLKVGGAVTHRAIERSPLVGAGWPALRLMESKIANVRVRSVGSLGGNLAFADPHSDPATFLLAANASVELGHGMERRTLPIDEFVLGPYETALRPGEIVVGIDVPKPVGGATMAHQRFAFHERPAATVSCLVGVQDGRLSAARIAIGSVGTRPVRALSGEALLLGADVTNLDAATLDAAGRAAADVASPVADANGSVDYKRDLVRVLVARCVHAAVAAQRPGFE